MSTTGSRDRKDNMDLADEKIEIADQDAGRVEITDHERTALTRKVLLKLDLR